jgi:hypothetical protein
LTQVSDEALAGLRAALPALRTTTNRKPKPGQVR